LGIHDEPPSEAARAEALRRRLAEADDRADSASSHDSAVHYDAPAGGGGGGAPLSTSILSQRVASPVPGGGTADTRAFTLVGVDVDDNRRGLSVRFSRNVDDLSSREDGRFVLSGGLSTGVVSVLGATVRVLLDGSLTPGTEYTLTVSPGLLASDGTTTLTGSHTATFTVATFRFLSASSRSPFRFVVLEFSDTVDHTTVVDGRFSLQRITPTGRVDVPLDSNVGVRGSTVTLEPTSPLPANRSYVAAVTSEINGMESHLMGGDPPLPLGDPTTRTFSTDSPPPESGFRVLEASASEDLRSVRILFSEPIAGLSTADASRFSIVGFSGFYSPTRSGSSEVTVRLSHRLAHNRAYEMRISGGVESEAGGELPTEEGRD